MRTLGFLVTGVMAAAVVACASGSESSTRDSDLTETSDAAVPTDGSVSDASAPPSDAAADAAIADASTPAIPTYDEVAPIIDRACARCHDSQFATLADVQDQHLSMLSLINRGRMPKGDPTWKNTPDGKKLVTYLTSSPDLQ